MAIPLAALAMPAIGAAMGGYEGYKQGGLGGALLGAGAGALVPKGLRIAGAALGGTALGAKVAPGLYKGAKALGLGGPSSLIGTAAQTRAGQAIIPGALTALGMGVGIPALAGGLVGGLARPAGQTAATAGQVALGNLAYRAPGPNQYGGAPYLPTDMYGGITPYGGATDVLGIPGTGQRLDAYKMGETMRDINRLMNAENYALREASAKQDMARNMAAAGIRQNIETRAAMQQRAQMAGINAGQQALADAGAILRNQYQYQ